MNPRLVPLLDLLFPRSCCDCGADLAAADEQGLCWDCRGGTHVLGPPWCDQCGMPVAGRIDHAFRCARCAETEPAYTRARSLYRYEGGVRSAIHALKYRRDLSVLPDLGRLLAAGLRVHFPELAAPVLVPVPLHPRRLRGRGFNQSLELCRLLRREIPAARLWTGLARVRATETQTRLSAAARRRNMQGAFRVRAAAVPEELILIDDVMTTGSTADACARALRKAGVERILVLTLARG